MITSKPDRAYALRPLMKRKMIPRAAKSMQISNPRGHHIYKKSEARIFKGLKLCFTPKPDRAYALRPLMDRKMNLEHMKKNANFESAWASHFQEIGRVYFQRLKYCASHFQ